MLSKRLLHLGYTIQVKSVIAGIVYVAQRRVFHFGHKEIYISKAIHVAVVVVVVVVFFFLRAGRDSKISVMTISQDNLH